MDEGKKKTIMIGIIIVSLVLVGVVTVMTRSAGHNGLDSIPEEKMLWVTCRNDKCNANYQMQTREYFRQLEEAQRKMEELTLVKPGLICEKCGEESLYMAFKCPKCGLVFESSLKRGDYEDRCPKCGYSNNERKSKEKAANGSASSER